jgi:hypothetical protein
VPPAPSVKVALRQDEYDRLCNNLGILAPPLVKIIQSRSSEELRGTYLQPTNTTTLFAGLRRYERDRLLFAARQLTRTLLHETRHCWQFQNWDEEKIQRDLRRPYIYQEIERDARDFADANVAEYMLVSVTRKQMGTSGLGRLDKTERAIRSR